MYAAFFLVSSSSRDLVFAASAASIEVSVIARQDDKVCESYLKNVCLFLVFSLKYWESIQVFTKGTVSKLNKKIN